MIYSCQGIYQAAESGLGRLEGVVMTGEDVRQGFEAVLPHEETERLCAQLGVIERQRKLDLGMLVRAGHLDWHARRALPGRRPAVVSGV